MSGNLKAFLDTIAVSEIGRWLLSHSDNGYNVIVGGGLFHDYKDHPRQVVEVKPGLHSTAAGRYQILSRYFEAYKSQLDLPDFSPASQDAIAVEMIRECHALPDIEAGHFEVAIAKCKSRWASLPGAGYGQHENQLTALRAAYEDAGGVVA